MTVFLDLIILIQAMTECFLYHELVKSCPNISPEAGNTSSWRDGYFLGLILWRLLWSRFESAAGSVDGFTCNMEDDDEIMEKEVLVVKTHMKIFNFCRIVNLQKIDSLKYFMKCNIL